MPETPNHGYNVPDEGEEDWHEPLNENFRQYDADIEVRDPLSDRSNYEPRDGAKFFATDTGDVLLGDGSRWRRIPTTGPVPTLDQLTIDRSVPLIRFRSDGEDLAELLAETSGSAARFLLSLFDDGGGRNVVLSANRENHVGIGRSGADVPLDVRSQNNWNLDNVDGDVRIGDDDYRLAIGVAIGGAGAGTSRIRAKGGTNRLNLGGGDSDTVEIDEDSMSVSGDLDVSGNKNFTQTVDTPDGEKEVVYTATEAGTPHTEVSGVAELEDGRAVVDLPEHFAWVTSDEEPLVVHVTPHARDPVRAQVTERSTARIVIEDLGDGPNSYELSYTVKGTREGHVDKRVVREPTETLDHATDDASTSDDEALPTTDQRLEAD